MTRAQYNEDNGKWHLTIQRPSGKHVPSHENSDSKPREDDSESFEDTADVLFTAIGGLSRWEWPDIEGLDTFQGKVIHSAEWKTGEGDSVRPGKWEDTVKSWGDKKVGVIGVVSSGSWYTITKRLTTRTRDHRLYRSSQHSSQRWRRS